MKFKFFILTILLAVLAACNEKDEDIYVDVTLTCTLPDNMAAGQLNNVSLWVKNVNTKRETQVELTQTDGNVYSFTTQKGFYEFSFQAEVTYRFDDEEYTQQLRGNRSTVEVINKTEEVELDLYLYRESSGFVIAEIFFTGTLTPEGKQYNGDKYFRIFNNSDSIQYADGLVLLEADFLTVAKRNYTPDIMSEAMAVQALYRVPGSGTDYPVQPGKSILIVDNAIDHRLANPNSFDLRSADFEWYDESTKPSVADIDNPDVTNMEKIYCYTLTIWVPHNRGFSSYALGRMEVDKETYLRDYTYFYDYDLVTNVGTFPMSNDSYRFPNDWIIDAVNLSVESEFQWIVTAPSLDQGWTYCGKINSDKTRYGKCVRRKVLYETPDGRKILKDTNNSAVDFDPEQPVDPFYFK